MSELRQPGGISIEQSTHSALFISILYYVENQPTNQPCLNQHCHIMMLKMLVSTRHPLVVTFQKIEMTNIDLKKE